MNDKHSDKFQVVQFYNGKFGVKSPGGFVNALNGLEDYKPGHKHFAQVFVDKRDVAEALRNAALSLRYGLYLEGEE